jgi:flavoprotein
MAIFEPIERRQPSADMGAERIKRSLQGAFQNIESCLGDIRRICERHGRKEIKKALGKEDEEVVKLYEAMQKFVNKHKPDAAVPDLEG